MIPKVPFYFVRHGQTDSNVEGRIQGHLDVPLNAKGVRQAGLVAPRLGEGRIRRIVCSPLARARQTAEIIRDALGVEEALATHDGLRERNHGSWQGRTWDEIYKDLGVAAEVEELPHSAPDSEPFVEMDKRVSLAVAEILTLGEGTLIVSHGGVFRSVQTFLLGDRGFHSENAVPYLLMPTESGWALRDV